MVGVWGVGAGGGMEAVGSEAGLTMVGTVSVGTNDGSAGVSN